MNNLQKFKDTMSFSSHGVSVFSINSIDNQILGTTITSFMSVSIDPYCFLVCLNRKLQINNYLNINAFINVHLLNSNQKHIAEIFSNKRSIDTYKDLFYEDEISNEKLYLRDSIVNIFAKIISFHHLGSHTIYICEIINSDVNPDKEDKPLIYYNRNYASVEYKPKL